MTATNKTDLRVRNAGLRRVRVADLADAPWNHRTHPQAQQEALDGAIDELGFYGFPDVYEAAGGVLMLIDGHLRKERLIAKYGADAQIEVNVTDFDEAEAKKANLTKDPLAAMAEVNAAKLDELLRECQTGSEALAGMLTEMAESAGLCKTGEVVEDDVPEPPADPVTKPGDLWLLGEHRLLCGDSTDAATVDRLFAGGRASLLFTSPPYGQQRDYGKAKELVKDWDGLMQGVFQHADRVMEPDGQVLVNLGLIHRDGEWLPYWDGWIAWMRERGWRRFGWYVWDQGFGLPGDWNGRLAPSHEFVFHFNKQPVRPVKCLDKKPENIKARHKGGSTMRGADGVCKDFTNPGASAQPTKILDSVLRINRMHGGHKIGHPAIFPVAFSSAMLQSWPGLAFEPFSGSGTTIIAAEQLGRRCYGLELEPKYCDVALQRWAKLTGKTPTLEDGTPFPVEVAIG